MSFRSVPKRLVDQARVQPDAPAYAVREGGAWRTTDWKTFTREVRETAAGLIALGLSPGDRVAILGSNGPCWTIADLGAMTAGCVPVGIYTSYTPAQAAYIIRHADAKVVFVGGADAAAKVASERETLPSVTHLVLFQGAGESPDGEVLTWEQFVEGGSTIPEHVVGDRVDALQEHDLGALIYTSGTTGPPKGSMLTHGNMAVASDLGRELLPGSLLGARHLSYLPMAHAAERALTLLGPASFGYAVYYAESIEQMASNLKEVQPDLFLGVPRVWEKIHDGIMMRLGTARGARARLIRWARAVGVEVNEARCSGREPHGRLAWRYGWARRLVFSKIRNAVGLGRANILLSGAAPLDVGVIRDLASLDLPIREVYGQTEDCGPTSNNRPGETRWGSVGRPFRGCEVRIAEDSEILVRGGHVFAGYFRDDEATSHVLRDGWLHSGDLGHFDSDGFLHITGRKKEILITAGGKNVAPRNLEEAIKRSALVEEAVVIGDRRKFLTALVSVNAHAADALVAGSSTVVPEVRDHPDLREAIWRHIQEVNAEVSPVEQIKRVGVLPHSLSVDTGELTPTLKVRRGVLVAKYADLIESLYAPDCDEPVIGFRATTS